jgi:hypothetical protein
VRCAAQPGAGDLPKSAIQPSARAYASHHRIADGGMALRGVRMDLLDALARAVGSLFSNRGSSGDQLAPRRERRAAARQRPHAGHRFWTERDRHPDPGAEMDIAHASDTWPLAKGIPVLASLAKNRRRR